MSRLETVMEPFAASGAIAGAVVAVASHTEILDLAESAGPTSPPGCRCSPIRCSGLRLRPNRSRRLL
ncbi:MAG: hypothetical protein ACRYFS_13945 [Janthinobacterium lividum]